MNTNSSTIVPFEVKDCVLIAIATGRRALNLRELREHILTVEVDCLYHHFLGGMLRPRFDDPEYNNDFAAWASRGLHDEKLAEQLSVLDPFEYEDMENLRHSLVDIIEERLDETEYLALARSDNQFHFITSKLIIFDTRRRLHEPGELAVAVPEMSNGSIFYHFIDARRRTPDALDDFRAWLKGSGAIHKKLCERLAIVDPFFPTLTELREQLGSIFKDYFDSISP
jgi:hypothetical protein